MAQVRLYTTTYCSYCQAAKRLLTERGYNFEEIDLTNDQETRMRLSAENNGYRTVPMIFIGDEFIGGFNELAALDRQGALAAKLGQ